MFHFLGLLLTVATGATGAYLLVKLRGKKLPTISKHASSTKAAYTLFAGSLLVVAIGFYGWISFWLIPHLNLGLPFEIVLAFMIVSLMATALIPDTHGLTRTLHRVSAYTMAVLFLPLALLITLSPVLATATRSVCLTLLAYMVITFTYVVLLRRAHHRYLSFQILYIVAFQLIVLSSAYLL